jgi:hypothetical protein
MAHGILVLYFCFLEIEIANVIVKFDSQIRYNSSPITCIVTLECLNFNHKFVKNLKK